MGKLKQEIAKIKETDKEVEKKGQVCCPDLFSQERLIYLFTFKFDN